MLDKFKLDRKVTKNRKIVMFFCIESTQWRQFLGIKLHAQMKIDNFILFANNIKLGLADAFFYIYTHFKFKLPYLNTFTPDT